MTNPVSAFEDANHVRFEVVRAGDDHPWGACCRKIRIRENTKRSERLPLRLALLPIFLLTLLGQVFPVGAPARGEESRSEEKRRPNIVLLISDDQRWDALGAMGNTEIQTPHLDQLAEKGVLFTESFCTTSICATSRASILTGQYARRHGIWDFQTPIGESAWEATFPALLREAGYRVGFVGKWGVGNTLPREQYDYFDGFPGQGRYYEPGSELHLTRRLGDSALEFLDTSRDSQPFCLHLAFKAPHCQDGAEWQFQYDRRYEDLYRDVEIPVLPTARDEFFQQLPAFLRDSEARARWKLRFADEAMYQKNVKDYYRLITGLDQVVGDLVARLKELDVLDNTVILFSSDNGFYLGDYGLAGKWFMHEASIRVPMVVYDPRQPEEARGLRDSRMTLLTDLAPTIVELAGLEVPRQMQGRSLVPLLRNEDVPWRQDFLYEHLFRHPAIAKSEGVRSGRWKYGRYQAPQGDFEVLTDLEADPLELVNLAQDPRYQAIRLAMSQRLEQLRHEATEDRRPTPQSDSEGGANRAETPVSEVSSGRAEIPLLPLPETRRSEQVDAYHGQEVADPYRWLEDVDSEETKEWVAAQNRVTFDYLAKIPERKEIERRLTELWNYERFGLPQKKGTRYFYTRNDGLQNQSVLYVAESLEGEPRVLLDPNKLSEDGTVALADWVVSENGKYLAFGLASSGSDWREWKVLDIDTGEELEDHVRWVKFSSVSWTKDSDGFFYSRYDEPEAGTEFTGTNYFHKLYYHRLGQSQDQDELVYERADFKDWGFQGEVTEDGRYLIILVWRGTENKHQIFYRDLQKEDGEVVELIAGFDSEYSFIGNEGETFYLSTDLDAPRRRVIAVNLESPERENWEEIVAERDEVLRGAGRVGGLFVGSYLQDARSVIRLFDQSGELVREVELPGIGTVTGFGGRSDDPETFYSFSSFTAPGIIYHYDVVSGETSEFRRPELGFEPEDYETKQVFYTSRDGTRVPMFITYRRGLELTGDTPTLLYGYGGFDISLTPSFSVANLVWMEMGGIYAMPNLRGGGEYGREWHESGMLDQKQNVFDDFIAAAEWLIAEGYTRSDKLAIRGGSNGGLLVGACMTQRPELFGAALPAVGVMDMLRYHKFTIGWAWVNEYGSSDDADQFANLIRYSPLHNLKSGVAYPATMVTTADHDDRVVPGHSFKFAAALQQAHAGSRPVLIRIETSAGHGAGTPTSKLIQAAADSMSFLVDQLDMVPDIPEPTK
jgi:prolyl oligopeptidase